MFLDVLRVVTAIGVVLAVTCCGGEAPSPAKSPDERATTSETAADDLPYACTEGFSQSESPDKHCEVTVPSRGGLCFSNGVAACECACGDDRIKGCGHAYSYPGQAFCARERLRK